MRVPVLCYHRVESPPSGFEHDSNFVTPTTFAAHLAALAALGCSGVTVSDIAAWQRGERTLPARPVAITFDDAYVSVLEHAIPLLDAQRWPCTIFVVTSQIGGTNAWDTGAPRSTLMNAVTLRTLAASGHEIGSHSAGHRRIRGLTDADARLELRDSREALESQLGATVGSFAFPYGSHDPQSLAQVRDAGYRAACTLKRWANGRASNPLRLGRMSVGGPLPAWQLGLKLAKLFVTPSRA